MYRKYFKNPDNPPTISILLSAMVLSLVGCSDAPESRAIDSQADLRITAPEQIASARVIDRELLNAFVILDGQSVNVTANEERELWAGRFNVPDSRAVSLVVEWMHEGLLIARYTDTIGPVLEQTRLVVAADDYESDGVEFDFDADGVSNLEELRRDTNPRDALNIDVRIQKANPGESPVVNGQPGVLWDLQPMIPAWKSDFIIDNLMIDAGANYPDGDTGFIWHAVYDDTYLYILVLAESVESATLQADSAVGVRDDALNIYIDGDNSKGETYDGIDDYHLIIPFLKLLQPEENSLGLVPLEDESGDLRRDVAGNLIVQVDGEELSVPSGEFQANDTQDMDGRVGRGQNSLPFIDDYRVVNAIRVVDRHVYELRLNLSELNIIEGRPFGIDLQIDDDTDGGARDARYGWRHPSRSAVTDTNVNYTASNPSFMGTAILD